MFEVKKGIVVDFVERYKRQRGYLEKMLCLDNEDESNQYYKLAMQEEKDMNDIVRQHIDKDDVYGISLACELVKAIGNLGLEKVIQCLSVCEVKVV